MTAEHAQYPGHEEHDFGTYVLPADESPGNEGDDNDGYHKIASKKIEITLDETSNRVKGERFNFSLEYFDLEVLSNGTFIYLKPNFEMLPEDMSVRRTDELRPVVGRNLIQFIVEQLEEGAPKTETVEVEIEKSYGLIRLIGKMRLTLTVTKNGNKLTTKTIIETI
jgi:hypothetical protein